jgi:hypothetical protein
MSDRRKITRTERRTLLRLLGKLTVACLALVDGATPEEILVVVSAAEDLLASLYRAVQTAEPIDEEGY